MLGKTPHSGKSRADRHLHESGHASSRAQARAAIEAGKVRADGVVVAKPAQPLRRGARIEFEPAHPFVSRGALKLVAALDRFQLSPENRVCLDIGASTGGFTQVLLARGATRVYAVDVGYGQLHASVKSDRRVLPFEGVNARNLSRRQVREPVDTIVADVSFISLKLVLAPALKLAGAGAWLVALVKPQFEVGTRFIGKGGIVQDSSVRERAVAAMADWIREQRWSVQGQFESPITGGSGNREYLIAASRE
ncbi:MAG TPA: TlyA family RNA methyltransferase [Rhizomicrobium sp.]|jgi:23S rRNA (cytidine1920-2'-O)/16S rRNA (cytidine1409-2'-O)-methyltransferase|nr:TlyA family RNA methyltransferase [Rhizomicrobium sp.]